MNIFKPPCPVYVTDTDGRRWYCQQGHDGHWGTCCGAKTPAEYAYELDRWKRIYGK